MKNEAKKSLSREIEGHQGQKKRQVSIRCQERSCNSGGSISLQNYPISGLIDSNSLYVVISDCIRPAAGFVEVDRTYYRDTRRSTSDQLSHHALC